MACSKFSINLQIVVVFELPLLPHTKNVVPARKAKFSHMSTLSLISTNQSSFVHMASNFLNPGSVPTNLSSLLLPSSTNVVRATRPQWLKRDTVAEEPTKPEPVEEEDLRSRTIVAVEQRKQRKPKKKEIKKTKKPAKKQQKKKKK